MKEKNINNVFDHHFVKRRTRMKDKKTSTDSNMKDKNICTDSNAENDNQNIPLLVMRHVFKTYETPSESFTALKDINLEVKSGEFVAIVGKSGSGKSTLINMLTGIDTPSSGEILVNSTQVNALDQEQLSVWRGKNIGVIFQFFQLLPTLTVAENVMLPMDFCKTVPSNLRREKALSLLKKMDIAEQADKLPADLSGGQQQRAAIARALANDPPILFADEPTGNLDSQTSGDVLRTFEKLAQEGKTVVMVTHERDLSKYFTRVVTLSDGAVVSENGFGSEVMIHG
jgi:putative ABC transport system ATP-binding protein